MALDFTAFETAMLGWLTAASALSAGPSSGGVSGVYNDDAKVPTPAYPYITFKMGALRRQDGSSPHDEITQDYVPGNPNGQQVQWTITGRREVTITIEVRTAGIVGAGTAKEYMAKVETGVQKPSQRDAFNAAGIAFLGFEPPHNLSERDGPMGMGRVVQDFYFAVLSSDTDLGTWIETVTKPVGTYTT